jgi:ribonucleotide monophosphatase NagD (HAD superfamily)
MAQATYEKSDMKIIFLDVDGVMHSSRGRDAFMMTLSFLKKLLAFVVFVTSVPLILTQSVWQELLAPESE